MLIFIMKKSIKINIYNKIENQILIEIKMKKIS